LGNHSQHENINQKAQKGMLLLSKENLPSSGASSALSSPSVPGKKFKIVIGNNHSEES
jgi:hypothetical protein